MSLVSNKSSLHTVIKHRQLNCLHDTSLEKRCPYCGFNHLRPGYCQALDVVNKAQFPHVWSEDGGYSEAVNPIHLRSGVPSPHRADTDTVNEESLVSNDFVENETDVSVTGAANETPGDASVTVGVATHTCAECGVTFLPKRSDAQYCSSACRQRAHRRAK